MVEPREAQLRLELCANSPNHPCPGRLCVERGNIEQSCLADTSVARHQQGPARDRRLVHELTDERDVRVSPHELSGITTPHGRPPHSTPAARGPESVGRSGSGRRRHHTTSADARESSTNPQ